MTDVFEPEQPDEDDDGPDELLARATMAPGAPAADPDLIAEWPVAWLGTPGRGAAPAAGPRAVRRPTASVGRDAGPVTIGYRSGRVTSPAGCAPSSAGIPVDPTRKSGSPRQPAAVCGGPRTPAAVGTSA